MNEQSIEQVVERFAQVTLGASEADLERPWAWGDYDSEGVRFAHFRTYEELRELAVRITAQRAALAAPASQAQCILAHYHSAYRDMLAALLGLSAEDAGRAPAPGEWPVRQVVAHIA